MTPSNKTKVCFISYREPFEVVLDNFSKTILHKDNYEVTLLGSKANYSEPYIDENNRKIIKLRLFEGINQGMRKFIFALKVIKYLNSNDFSIIHIDISCRYFGLMKLFTKGNKKFVFHILSYPVTNSKITRYKKMFFIYLQCILFDKIIVQSQEIKDRWLGIKKMNRAIVIPVGFNKKQFFPLKNEEKFKIQKILNIPQNVSIIAYSGVISSNRNLENLIYSMLKIHESNKHTRFLFIVLLQCANKYYLIHI